MTRIAGRAQVGQAALLLAAVLLLGAGTGLAAARWTAGVGQVSLLAVADDGTTVAADKTANKAVLLTGATGAAAWEYPGRGDQISGVGITADGSRIILSESQVVKPQTELTQDRLVMLDRDGRVMWEQLAQGRARISAQGRYLLTYDREHDFGLRVLAAQDGGTLWEAPREQLGQMEAASFSRDGEHVLVQAANRVTLFSARGERLWAMGFPAGVRDAATSASGEVTAILLGGSSRRLVLVDRSGKTLLNRQLLRRPEGAPANWEYGDWEAVAVPGDGRQVVLQGYLPGRYELQMLDITGKLLWDRTVPKPDSSASLQMLGGKLICLTVETEQATQLHLFDAAGKARPPVELPGASACGVGPNGRFASLAAGATVQSLALPGADPAP